MTHLVLLQIVAYLFISPWMIADAGGGTDYRLDLSIIFLLSFLVGSAIAKFGSPSNVMRRPISLPLMTLWLKLSLIALTVLYVFVVLSNGLMTRRQGSEVMAEIFANLPVAYLLILRIYEIVFYPVLLVVLVGLQKDRGTLTKLLLLGFFTGFIFMGVLDSRAKLLAPLLFYYVLFIASRPNWRPIPTRWLLAVGLGVGLMVVLIGMDRVSAFDGASEYLFEDVLRRVDGLELISTVDSAVEIPFWGTLDTQMFSNFVASIPFVEGASALKESGLTSSKSYLLQVVLGYAQYDINNSVVTDLYYFGGYVLLIFGACLYGYLVMVLDNSVRSNRMWRSQLRLAFLLSFLINALRIEQDYFSIVFSTLRDFLIIYLLLFGFRFNSSSRTAPG